MSQNYNEVDLANCIRILSADAIQKANSGHPGMPLGMADVMTVLASRFLKYNPNDPSWFGRDRFVLSAGHGSMLLYSFYYLCGYNGFNLEQISSFRSLESICAGHPEYTLHEAIETTTGPLGQGIANSVGMAIAQKKYQQKLGNIASYDIYCVAGDGCLMEGISYEAMSLAGHLQLNNLIIIFDDNSISIDGNTNLTISDDHLKKYESMGFYVQSIDGHNHEQIALAINNAKLSDKPSFIACKTTIGKGTQNKEGSEKSHGSPLGIDEISYLKKSTGFEQTPFAIEESILDSWRNIWKHNEEDYDNWHQLKKELTDDHASYMQHHPLSIPDNINNLPEEATRASSGRILEQIIQKNEKAICGSADLAGSNNIMNRHSRVITKNDFSGNFIHFGVRENAMAAICNGLAISGFNPICATFFVFTDYMRPSIRLSAIMKLPVLYVMTHDSIGVGEDGPTHQPVEHLASLRAMPGIDIYRPADGIETLASYKNISKNHNKPSMLVLTRQKIPAILTDSQIDISEGNAGKGAYIISEANHSAEIDYCLYASGSEVSIALELQKKLQNDNKSVRVVSMLSMDIFLQQQPDYIKSISGRANKLIAIEAGSDFGWHRIIGSNGLFFGVRDFGHSAPAKDLYEYFGLTVADILESISNLL